MDFMWSWTDGLFQGICSCGNGAEQQQANKSNGGGNEKQQPSLDVWAVNGQWWVV